MDNRLDLPGTIEAFYKRFLYCLDGDRIVDLNQVTPDHAIMKIAEFKNYTKPRRAVGEGPRGGKHKFQWSDIWLADPKRLTVRQRSM